MHYLLSVASIKLEEVFASLGNALDRGAYGEEYCCLVEGSAYCDARDVFAEGFRALKALDKFSFFVFPVLEGRFTSHDDYERSGTELAWLARMGRTYTFGACAWARAAR